MKTLILTMLALPLLAQQPKKHHAGTPYVIQQDTIKERCQLRIIQRYRVAGSTDTLCREITTSATIKSKKI